MVTFIAAAFMLGFLHSFGPDHVAAVTAFTSTKRSAREAIMTGISWSAGHGGIVILAGVLATFADVVIPVSFERTAEMLAGVAVLVVGFRVLAGALAKRGNKIPHAHVHTHEHGETHVHFHTHTASHNHSHPFSVGLVHGLAGSGGVLVAIPVILANSTAGSVSYVTSFAFGSLVAMSLFAYGLFRLYSLGTKFVDFKKMQIATGLLSVVVGCVWVVRAI